MSHMEEAKRQFKLYEDTPSSVPELYLESLNLQLQMPDMSRLEKPPKPAKPPVPQVRNCGLFYDFFGLFLFTFSSLLKSMVVAHPCLNPTLETSKTTRLSHPKAKMSMTLLVRSMNRLSVQNLRYVKILSTCQFTYFHQSNMKKGVLFFNV